MRRQRRSTGVAPGSQRGGASSSGDMFRIQGALAAITLASVEALEGKLLELDGSIGHLEPPFPLF